jgi:hypothetical protein
MIVLANGGQPLKWSVRMGGDGLRAYLGKVLAHLPNNDLHPYVVWSMASDDNQSWDCFGGDYHSTIERAEEAFTERWTG